MNWSERISKKEYQLIMSWIRNLNTVRVTLLFCGVLIGTAFIVIPSTNLIVYVTGLPGIRMASPTFGVILIVLSIFTFIRSMKKRPEKKVIHSIHHSADDIVWLYDIREMIGDPRLGIGLNDGTVIELRPKKKKADALFEALCKLSPDAMVGCSDADIIHYEKSSSRRLIILRHSFKKCADVSLAKAGVSEKSLVSAFLDGKVRNRGKACPDPRWFSHWKNEEHKILIIWRFEGEIGL